MWVEDVFIFIQVDISNKALIRTITNTLVINPDLPTYMNLVFVTCISGFITHIPFILS